MDIRECGCRYNAAGEATFQCQDHTTVKMLAECLVRSEWQTGKAEKRLRKMGNAEKQAKSQQESLEKRSDNFRIAYDDRFGRRRRITVHCSKCGELNELKVEVLNIEEDIQGADVLTFKCPRCKKVRKSRRYG